jgi:signal transduction histidine kinase
LAASQKPCAGKGSDAKRMRRLINFKDGPYSVTMSCLVPAGMVTSSNDISRVVSEATPESNDRASSGSGDARMLAVACCQCADAGSAPLDLSSYLQRKLLAPLNAMLGFAQIMQADRREPLSVRHRARLDQILQSGEQIARLVDEIADLGRLEAGTMSVSLERVDTLNVLKQVMSALEPSARHASTSVWIEASAGDVPAVFVDPKRFFQILVNLGSNAIRHNRPHGAVRFLLAPTALDRLRISVHDNGSGISPQHQATLSRLLGRTDEDGATGEITGIGLLMAKRLAELMRGSIGFRSTPGAGSEFWVDVPLHVSNSSEGM